MAEDDLQPRLAALEMEVQRLRRALEREPPPVRSKREALLLEAERVAHMGSWAWNLQTNEISWSDELYCILGLSPDHTEPSAADFFASIHPEDRARVEEVTTSSLAADAPEPVEFRVVQPHGEVRHVRMEAALVHDEHGQRAHMVGTCLDTTEQLRTATLLERAVEQLNEAERLARLGSWRWSLSDDRVEWSRGLYLLLGVPPTVQPTAELFLEHVHPDDLDMLLAARAKAFETRVAIPLEYRMTRSDGAVREVAMLPRIVCDGRGELTCFYGVIQDVTEQKTLEAQLRHSQMMEAVGTLAGGVAHDFNNYLTVIAGHADLLGAQLPADHPGRPSVSAILDAYDRCASLTKQLLTLSRKRQAQPRDVQLVELLAGLRPMLQSMLGETFELCSELPKGTSPVRADPAQIEQVVMNLVVNARDAMPEGGRITIRAEDVLMDSHRSEPRKPPESGHYVRLSVQDTGEGIAEGIRARIFEPFFTTKPVGEGTGLGLSTVYGILKEVSGAIEVDSEVGVGSTFHTYWPASHGGSLPAPAPGSEEIIAGAGQTVLLVEDVEQVRELLRNQLELAGYRVRTASDGAEALSVVAETPVNAVVSDVVMPRMGGVELASHLSRRYPAVPCILMTGYSAEVLGGLTEQTRHHVLRKPFAPRELINALGRLLTASEG